MLTAAGHATENDRAVRLVEAYREGGDRRAMERLLVMHRGILNKVVRRHSGSSGEPYEDLMQVGYVGLIKAVNDYDAGSPARFSSYAYAKIEGELRHHSRDAGLVRRRGGRGACTERSPRRRRSSPASFAAPPSWKR